MSRQQFQGIIIIITHLPMVFIDANNVYLVLWPTLK